MLLTWGQGSPLWWSALAITGLLIGILSGLFGVGGGFLLTPLLTTVFGVSESIAVGTGVSQMVGTALSSFLRYQRMGYGNTRLAWGLIGGALMGANAGAMLLGHLGRLGSISLNNHEVPVVKLVLTVLFVLLLFGIALLMLGKKTLRPNPPLAKCPAFLWGYVGFGIGVLSGLMGIGGGILLVPLMIYGFGISPLQATASATLVLLSSAVMGTVSHALRGNVYLSLTMTLLIGSTLGAQWGALRASKTAPLQLQRYFTLLVTLTALWVLGHFLWTIYR
jgi:uncharacterized protein